MAQLSTGLIIAGAYADKIRKTLFAQLRNEIRNEEVTSQEVARAAAELNQLLYRIIVDKLKSDKGDVVRARIQYDLENGQIKWKYDTLQLEYFKRVPDEEVAKIVSEALSTLEMPQEVEVKYTLEKVLTTSYGDHIFNIKMDDEFIGALVVTPVNEEMAIIRGAVTKPNPIIVKRGKVTLAGKTIDEAILQNLESIFRMGEGVSLDEAKKVISDIEAIIESEQ